MRYNRLLEKTGTIAQRVKPVRGAQRVQTGVKSLMEEGLLKNPKDRREWGQLLREMPGPFGGDVASDQDIMSFFDWLSDSFEFDPVGYGSDSRLAGLGVINDPRNDYDPERADCDLYSIVATDVAAGSTGANSTGTITNLDTAYRKAVLWLYTDGGRIRNITTLTVDNRQFYLGPANSMPADVCDLTLEPHPRRQGIYLGNLNRSLSVTVFIPTSATAVHWEILLDAEIDNANEHRPGGRVLHKFRSRPGTMSLQGLL